MGYGEIAGIAPRARSIYIQRISRLGTKIAIPISENRLQTGVRGLGSQLRIGVRSVAWDRRIVGLSMNDFPNAFLPPTETGDKGKQFVGRLMSRCSGCAGARIVATLANVAHHTGRTARASQPSPQFEAAPRRLPEISCLYEF